MFSFALHPTINHRNVKELQPYDALIAKYLQGETSPEETRNLFAWVNSDPEHRRYFEEMQQVWELTAVPDWQPSEQAQDAAWQNLARILDDAERPPRAIAKRRFWWLRVAAALVVGALLAWWWLAPRPSEHPILAVYQTLPGESTEVYLPDSSRVILNANSRLEHEIHFSRRQVTLIGEAFFEVTPQKGSPFTVQAGALTTTVLGTAFNVRAYPVEASAEVQVVHGRVAVQADSGDQRILEAGQGVRYDSSTKVFLPLYDPNLLAWQSGRLSFDESRLDAVLQSLERFAGKAFIVEDPTLLNCRFTAHFENPSWEQVLEVLCATLDCSVQVNGDTVVLKGAGCR